MNYLGQSGKNTTREVTVLRAAVCITGAVRSLPVADVHRDLKRFVVDRWDADVFLVLHMDNTTRGRHGLGGNADGFKLAGVKDAIDELKPRRGILHDTRQRRRLKPCGARLDVPNPLNCAPQFHNHDRCPRLVTAAETEDESQYHWVLLTRPDLHWEAPLPTLQLVPTSRAWALAYKVAHLDSMHTKDFALLVPRPHLNSCLRYPASLNGCTPPGDLAKTRNAICGFEPAGGCECVLARALAASRVPLGFFFSKAHVERLGLASDRSPSPDSTALCGEANATLVNSEETESDPATLGPSLHQEPLRENGEADGLSG